MHKLLSRYWTGKSVIITGASSGLGWALVEALAPYHVQFCLLSRREDKMKMLADKLKNSGSTFWIKSCDIRKRKQVENAIEEFYNTTGSIDVVWANSGIGTNSSFHHWNWDRVEAVIDTNIKGTIYTVRAGLEKMVKQNSGAIVGVGSAVSMRGLPTRGIYSLTKIAIAYFLESLAAEFPQIQFTIIHPGFVDTPMNSGSPARIWLITPEKAAQLMIKAVAKRKRQLIYPFRMNLLYRFIRLLPTCIYLTLSRKIFSFYNQQK